MQMTLIWHTKLVHVRNVYHVLSRYVKINGDRQDVFQFPIMSGHIIRMCNQQDINRERKYFSYRVLKTLVFV